MSWRGAVAFATALVALFVAGLWLGGHPGSLPGPLREVFVTETGGLSAEAAEVIEDSYYRPAGGKELSNASLQGMVRELRRRHKEDRYSEYFSPQALESFNQSIEGRFSGIGVSIKPVKHGLAVEKVFPHTPAEAAGIKAGETIVAVEGEPIAKLSVIQATERIKGPEGTQVRLAVRGKDGKVRQLTLTRAEVALPNVSSRVEKTAGHELGYVRMLQFSEGAHEQIANAVRKVEGEGAEGIVLDLRGNPGGLLQEAVLCAGVFLPEGEVVVSTKSRTQGEQVYKTKGGGNLPARPLVVLVDRGTASAAEILAAALADDGGAEVVGTRTYGKGLFQEEQSLSNGGALKLSVGEFFTPEGVNLAESHGVHPDVKAADNPATRADEAKAAAFRVLAGQVGH